MAWCYEIRGSQDRLVEVRSGFATEKKAREAGKRAKRMIDSLCSPYQETLTLITKNNRTELNGVSEMPSPEPDSQVAPQRELKLKYPWQQAVLDAFLEPQPRNLPRKINVAERAISARLLESDPFDLDERIALGEALLALKRLVAEQNESKETSREKKGIA